MEIIRPSKNSHNTPLHLGSCLSPWATSAGVFSAWLSMPLLSLSFVPGMSWQKLSSLLRVTLLRTNFWSWPTKFRNSNWFQIFSIQKTATLGGFSVWWEGTSLFFKLPGAPPELWALQKSAEQRLGHYDKDTWRCEDEEIYWKLRNFLAF